MSTQVLSLIQACQWLPSRFLIFSGNVFDPLIYYSHFGAIIPTLLIGIFVFWKGRKDLASKLLFLMILCFSVWVYSDLVLWASEFPSYVMFFWTLEIIFEPFVYFFAFYFFYVFVFKKDFSLPQKIIFALPLIPTILLAPTKFGLLGFDISNCDRAAAEGILATYGYGIEILYTILLICFAIYAWVKIKEQAQRTQIILLAIGICLFLLSFSFGNIVQVFSQNWSIDQYNLFGAPVFTAFLAYIIVRFKAFRARLIGPQALVFGLAILVFSLLFVTSIKSVRIITSVTFLFVVILGYLLIRSVYREIEQREKIEKLADDLEKANKQQVVLLHFITHQIKGFLTKSRNTFSLALEGDLGPLPDAMRPIFQQAFDSDTQGVNTVQEILNAANVKSGAVTYMMEPFDLAKLVEEVANGLKPNADAKGLAFTVDIGEGTHTINGDHLQLQNAIKNLIDNSIKYTPSGSVTVSLKQEGTMLRFMIQDTGVGITPEDMAHLFTEGGHGKDSQKVNVESTGFGLYIVKNIAEAHHGKVWAESEGAGKGSKFILELPISDTPVAPAA